METRKLRKDKKNGEVKQKGDEKEEGKKENRRWRLHWWWSASDGGIKLSQAKMVVEKRKKEK